MTALAGESPDRMLIFEKTKVNGSRGDGKNREGNHETN